LHQTGLQKLVQVLPHQAQQHQINQSSKYYSAAPIAPVSFKETAIETELNPHACHVN